jgi:hypothetical protein
LRGRKAWLAWALLGVSIPVGIFIIFTSGDVAYWYQSISQITPTRAASSQTPLGSYTFQLGDSSGEQTDNLAQLLPFSQVLKLRGKTVTLGYWIWANQPVKIHSPLLKDDQQYYSELIEVTPKPTFHAFAAKIAGSTRHLQIILVGPNKPGDLIFIDGLVLVKGDFTASGSPLLADAGGQHGTWGGKSFENPIRNASAEQAWPRPRAFIQRLVRKMSPVQPNMILASLADWKNSRWYYRTTIKQLFRTFWGQFGWGQIPLSRNTYIVLSVFTALGGLGSLAGLWRDRKFISWGTFALMGISALWIWGAALMRGVVSITWSVFIPSARYAFPAIIPTVYVLSVGWAEWPRLFERWLRIPGWVKLAGFLTLFLLLDTLSIWAIAHYYGYIS